jgi:2-aminoadipate transaminase
MTPANLLLEGPAMPTLEAPAAEIPLADWTRGMKQSPLREIHTLLSRPGLLSFALGMPAAELFPVAAYARAARHVLRTDPEALQYGLPLRRLKSHVVGLMARRGVACTEAEVFITSGAQHAMSLLGQLLVAPGASVVTEEMAYDGMLNALRPLQPRVRTVPSDVATGMDVEALEALLASGERPALVYTIPEGHNPLGASMPADARRRLVEAAARHGVPVIEDDAYGLLGYDDAPAPALRTLDPRWTLYVGSFSKIMAPALRAGWIVAPEPLVQRLSILKQGSDLDVCSFAQRSLAAFLDREDLDAHLARLRQVYGARRDALLAALAAHFPAEARWSCPRAGIFAWVQVPGADTTALLRRAVEEAGVAFVPGRAFCAQGGTRGGDALRLNFSRPSVEQIHDGIQRLAGILAPRAVRLPAGLRPRDGMPAGRAAPPESTLRSPTTTTRPVP